MIQIQAIRLQSPASLYCIIWVSSLLIWVFVLNWKCDSSLLFSSQPSLLFSISLSWKGKSAFMTQVPFPGGGRTLAHSILSLYFWWTWRIRPLRTQGSISPPLQAWLPGKSSHLWAASALQPAGSVCTDSHHCLLPSTTGRPALYIATLHHCTPGETLNTVTLWKS